ncbi:MAG: hypothetical protein K0S64_275 [Gaiellaceae bacterium]|jgi:hypothetical protein|nr:hypothetical protein [Gaiellaceae bacterium]
MTTKRQQTMAKITRERAVREKRERKLEKKRAAKAERKARAELGLPPIWEESGEDPTLDPATPGSAALLDAHEPHGDDGPVLGERVVPGL